MKQRNKQIPLNAAQLTAFIKANMINPSMTEMVKAAELLREGLQKDKEYKCPCGDGAGTGTSNNGLYVCEGCDGNGWSDTRVVREVIQSRLTKQG